VQPLSKWQLRFVRLSFEVATWSKDPDCPVGAVLVSPDGCNFAAGYNGFPRGVKDNAERLLNKEMKNLLTAHAEINSLLNSHGDVRGWELYVTKAPCHKCAAPMLQAGISKVFCPPVGKDSDWSHSCLLALSMFKEAGVKVVQFDPELARFETLNRGQ
jgi:dCMP deaminase